MSSVRLWFEALAPAPLQLLTDPVFQEAGITVQVLREDLRGGLLSGNKARKLKYALIDAEQRQVHRLISMGGPYSNHLHALAAAGKLFGFATQAIVRGELPTPLTPTLKDCAEWGMAFVPVSRQEFRHWREQPERYFDAELGTKFIAEGGSGAHAIRGVMEMLQEHQQHWDIVLVAAGTGATAAGIAASGCCDEVWAVPVLKQGEYLRTVATKILADSGYVRYAALRWLKNHHHGGYGRVTPTLNAFCAEFFAQHQIELEPIYTGKVFYALYQLARSGRITRGKRVLLIHTGGMQGKRDHVASLVTDKA